MTFNLIRDPWLPVRLRGGERALIRPAEIAAGGEAEPVAFDYPRPDLETAAYEFLIGLLTLAAAPRSKRDWRERYAAPPSRDALEAAFAPLERAFDLDGDGARFCQEFGGQAFEHEKGAGNPIDSLLIDAPGENAVQKNSDLLTHRGRYGAVSRAAAAILLYAMQSAAPLGGRGNLTSLRGGGPLTLLTIPGGRRLDEPPSLWRQLWANVVAPEDLGAEAEEAPALERVLPWLAPPCLDGALQPNDPRAHPLQAFFGTPRRFWLLFGETPIRCPILGLEDARPAVGVVQKPRGVDYGVWTHPLTPYRRQKEADPPYSAKPKSGRFGYRDWVAGVLGDETRKLLLPALTMQKAQDRAETFAREDAGQRPTVRAAGWAMNNMEAKEYLLAETPLHFAEDPELASETARVARRWAEAGDLAHRLLRKALKAALFGEGAKASTDKGVFETARTAFFDRTEPAFHELVEEVSLAGDLDALLKSSEALGRRWLRRLRLAALELFDELAPLPLNDPLTAEPIVEAERWMTIAFSGYGAAGGKLFDSLALEKPAKSKKKKDGAEA